jgi:hypothetical protein
MLIEYWPYFFFSFLGRTELYFQAFLLCIKQNQAHSSYAITSTAVRKIREDYMVKDLQLVLMMK